MAMKPLKPCRHPGCLVLTSDAYCPAHKPQDKTRRSAESASWRWMYQTREWAQDLRPGQLLAEPFCRECAKRGKRVYATDVDHIVDHKGDWTRFVDRRNLQSLCHSCHSRKTLAEMRSKNGALRSRYSAKKR